LIDIVIDTETTGLDSDRCQVISIGWAFRNPDENENNAELAGKISSGNILIRPDMERLGEQNSHELDEALNITGFNIDGISKHEINYYTAIEELKMQLRKSLRLAGFESSQFGGYDLRNIRILAYNRQFDFDFLNSLPYANTITARMPSFIFEEDCCDNYACHLRLEVDCSCRKNSACIMLRASERWGHYSEYHGNYRWLKLVTAFSYLDLSDSDKIQTAGLSAHDSQWDSIMALIVHEHLGEI
jgi:hypothetical protein